MLNPSLYGKLKRLFSFVDIANEGCPIMVEDRRHAGLVQRWKTSSGEQYRVNCPCCGDQRARLYISYAWGMDRIVGFPTSKLVVCHNEHCEENDEPGAPFRNNPRTYLELKLNPYFSDIRKGLVTLGRPDENAVAQRREKLIFPKPEWSKKLHEMHERHPAVEYFRDARKFDLELLYNDYGVVFADEYPVKAGDKDYSFLAGRVFIPVTHNNTAVGWQARIADNNDVSKTKYFNCPGWHKSQSIYNLDAARQHTLGLLVEGVTDVWRVGNGAFSTFGKDISMAQEELIVSNFDAVGVLYDPDTDTDMRKSALLAISRLSRKISKVFRVYLPDNRDPADCSYDLVWSCIRRDAQKVGIAC